ncbi:MAG: winged helix-turn-helix domain-containing protein [Alphaproteobacteria bacterium]|nr:winged helix-turn-helix domain-containing protein [Alphaproteobacteria bacterium]
MTMNIRTTSSRRRNPPSRGASWLRRPSAAGAELEFGRFRVVLRRRQLLADGFPVELGMRAFDILMVLLEADGALVTKGELLSRVWPGIIVTEENVKLQISTLRKALGADRDLILTECGRGYRFTGVLRADTRLEGCRPMPSERRSAPSLTLPRARGRQGWAVHSCRHSLQCSVNSSRALTGEDFAVSAQ